MKMLNDYFKLQKEIYEYFGYVEDWVVIPIEDSTDSVWELGADEVRYADTLDQLNNIDAGDYYINELYHQRFLPKSIYKAKDYTMLVVDTRCDGNKFLQIFDNSKQIKKELK